MHQNSSRFHGLMLILMMAALPFGAVKAFSAAEGNNNLDNFPNEPGAPLGFTGSPTVLTVTPGINLAYGQFRCQGFGCQDHYDSFRIEVPMDLQINLTEFSAGDSGNFGVPEELHIFPGPADGTGIFIHPEDAPAFVTPPNYQDGSHIIRLFDFPDATDTPDTSSIVLGPGFYDVVPYNFNFLNTVDEWEVRFTAGPHLVPLPAAVWLFAAAVAGISGFARKRVTDSSLNV